MHCFNHQEISAIGTCKACSKGLCIECATDLGHGLACKNQHENMVETYNSIVEKNSKIYSAAPKNILIGPIFLLFMGSTFAFYGYRSHDGVTSLPFMLGLGFMVFAFVTYLRSKALFKAAETRT